MAWEGDQDRQSFNAGEDLRAAQFRFVLQNGTGDNIVRAGAITDRPIGVLQNKPNTDQEATVCYNGDTKLVAGAAITRDAVIGTDNQGRAVPIVIGTDETQYVLGRAIMPASAAGVIFTAHVDCPEAALAAN